MVNLHPLLYAGAFAIGCTEWFLAVKRTLAVIKGNRLLTGVTVAIEVYLGFLVALVSIKELSTPEALLVYALYCVGGSVGSVLPLRSSKCKK